MAFPPIPQRSAMTPRYGLGGLTDPWVPFPTVSRSRVRVLRVHPVLRRPHQAGAVVSRRSSTSPSIARRSSCLRRAARCA